MKPTHVFAVLACLVALAPAVVGQTPVWRLQWDQPAPTLAEAQGYLYSVRVDTQAPTSLTATCAGTAPAKLCSAPLPPLTSGPHTLVLTATNAFGSASSAPLAGAPPLPAINVTVIVQVTVP